MKLVDHYTCHAPRFEDDKEKRRSEKQDPNNSMIVETADKVMKGL